MFLLGSCFLFFSLQNNEAGGLKKQIATVRERQSLNYSQVREICWDKIEIYTLRVNTTFFFFFNWKDYYDNYIAQHYTITLLQHIQNILGLVGIKVWHVSKI